jgi:hypothetical protein
MASGKLNSLSIERAHRFGGSPPTRRTPVAFTG